MRRANSNTILLHCNTRRLVQHRTGVLYYRVTMTSETPVPSLSRYWPQLRKPLELEVARGCPDTAIVGVGIGNYARLWAERLKDGADRGCPAGTVPRARAA